MRVVVRGLGWLLVAAGVVIALYLVYSLFWTTLETRTAQRELRDDWELEVGDVEGRLEGGGAVASTGGGRDDPEVGDDPVVAAQDPSREVVPVIPLGEAVAALEFERPGSDEPPVLDAPVLVVEGVHLDALATGPGHYVGSALPGRQGNFAVAGHRTTHGAPFFDLDQAQPGDLVHVQDRDGIWFTYEVRESRIVQPDAVSVLGPDPLSTGQPTLTLTTCNPRFSMAERLVVLATLQEA